MAAVATEAGFCNLKDRANGCAIVLVGAGKKFSCFNKGKKCPANKGDPCFCAFATVEEVFDPKSKKKLGERYKYLSKDDLSPDDYELEEKNNKQTGDLIGKGKNKGVRVRCVCLKPVPPAKTAVARTPGQQLALRQSAIERTVGTDYLTQQTRARG